MSPISDPVKAFLNEVRSAFDAEATTLIEQAYQEAAAAHSGQLRGTGEPYVEHSVAVATILKEWGLDAETVAAALLHDVPEDTAVSLDQLRQQFPPGVCDLVEAVTKLSAVRLPEESVNFEMENLRRLFLAMAKDLRVVLLKLADRLHNMRTIKGVAEAKRQRIGRETLEIYAPLADRLGMGEVRTELDDRGFRAADPAEYAWTRAQVDRMYNQSTRYLARIRHEFSQLLKEAGITAEISTRSKNLYSLHKKLLMKERDIDKVYDFFAVRVIVSTVAECYQGMGLIHQSWQPLPNRIKDYIAVPKQNGYRSLHTTVFGPEKHLMEVQFRTTQMHREAELGVAAHIIYAETKESHVATHEQLKVMEQLASWQDELSDESADALPRFKLDLFADRIFVFTPKGAPYSLPAGSTPIDFAYHVHTEVGNTCTGAKVNGVISPLDAALQSGDVVQILTTKSSKPKRDWLNIVRTGHARTSIRGYFRRLARGENIAAGRELLEAGLRQYDRALSSLEKGEWDRLVAACGVKDADGVLLKLGEGEKSLESLLRVLGLATAPASKAEKPPKPTSVGIALSGMGSLLTKRASCCHPEPPQQILGYITVGKGISIHRRSCPQIKSLPDPSRIIPVAWEA